MSWYVLTMFEFQGTPTAPGQMATSTQMLTLTLGRSISRQWRTELQGGLHVHVYAHILSYRVSTVIFCWWYSKWLSRCFLSSENQTILDSSSPMPLQQNTNSILFIQSLNVFQYSRNPKYHFKIFPILWLTIGSPGK